MFTIESYTFNAARNVELALPKNAWVFIAEATGTVVTLHAVVDSEAPDATRCLATVEEGTNADDVAHGHYLATVQIGQALTHIFDMGEKQDPQG